MLDELFHEPTKEELALRKKLEKLRKKEEKRLRLQREAEELRLKKRKENMEREMSLFEANKKKVKRMVHKIAMETNLPLIKTEMLVRWAAFERANDVKDWQISCLLEELDRLAVHRETAQQFQMELNDRIIEMTHSKLEEMHSEYLKRRNQLLTEKDSKDIQLRKTHKNDEESLKALIYDLGSGFKAKLTKEREQNSQVLQERTDENENELEKTEASIQNNLESLWKDFSDTYREYETNTYEIRKWYLDLKEKDGKDNNEILLLTNKIAYLHENIEFYKDLESRNIRKQKEINDLSKERKTFEKAYNIMWDDIRRDSAHDQTQIIFLSDKSYHTLKELSSVEKKVETLLKYVKMCQKLETEEEKVAPPIEIPGKIMLPESLTNLQELEKFWLRHSSLTLQNDYLKELLKKEQNVNGALQNKFKEIFIEPKELPNASTSGTFQ